ncbi:Sulfotransferase domain protein [Stieleria bergensis]|uniref:Sulfotransferase domain protein n=1 Tax=Stieleria bergensis TaxID=2528025 RepID=A0A517T013_9BACT|nr:Sulfotransferase domain protein [Planctomycetes bacterium SV_7m_r]
MAFTRTIFLSAGMPRSGSTWLYNVARLLIESDTSLSKRFTFGWVGDFKKLPTQGSCLIKLHEFDAEIAESADVILYSYRDIRDATASPVRKFNKAATLDMVDQFVREHGQWAAKANYVMRYEDMLVEKETIVQQVATTLGIAEIDPAVITASVEALAYESKGKKRKTYHKQNLYHRNHITDGRHGSWQGVLSDEFVEAIEQRHAEWLHEHGYQLAHEMIS